MKDAEFLADVLERAVDQYGSLRQFALAIPLQNAQSINHWKNRGRVPDKHKIRVAQMLGIKTLAGYALDESHGKVEETHGVDPTTELMTWIKTGQLDDESISLLHEMAYRLINYFPRHQKQKQNQYSSKPKRK